MRLSYSSISTYQNCPLQYKFIEVDKMPIKRTPALDFGESLHKALQFLYSMPVPPPPSLEEVLTNLKKIWRKGSFSGETEEKAYFEHAKQILATYYKTNIDGKEFQIPVALEHYFQIDFDGLTVSGRIDRMDKLPSGGYEIVDYKTNRRLPSLAQVHKDFQLSIYHWAAQETWGITPEKLTLYFLLPNETISTCRSEDEVEETKAIIKKVSKDIQAGSFEPRENPLCPWCSFQPYCPYYKHLYMREESAKDATQFAQEEQEDIEKTIDEYISLKRQERDLRERLFELQEVIHRYCEQHNLTKLYSEKGVITRALREQLKIDEERLREILEPLKLWEKVLKVDKNQVKELLKSSSLADEAKRAIEAIIEIENIAHALYLRDIQSERELPSS